MNKARKLWSQLSQSNLIVGDYPTQNTIQKPWYLRLLQGVAGWFAGLLMLGFFALTFSELFDYESQLALIIVGILCSVAAYLLFKNKENDFLNQFALALSLAGQALFAFAVFASVFRVTSTGLFVLAAYQLLLVFLLSNYMHRLITSGFALIALIVGLYEIGLLALGVAFCAVALSFIWLKDKNWGKNWQLWEPIGYGLAIALVYSRVFLLYQPYLFSYSYRDIDTSGWFFSHAPLLSSLLVSLVFINLLWTVVKENKKALAPKELLFIFLFGLVVVAMSFYIIGMSTGVLLVLLGFIRERKALLVIGLFSLIGFISWYYYSLQYTLLTKSLLLIGVGILMLGVYAIFNYLYRTNESKRSFSLSIPSASQWLILTTVAILLLATNISISKKESLLEHGDKLLFRLAPVDPRSIMQGDYMRLRFEVGTKILDKLRLLNTQKKLAQQAGFAVVEKNDKGVVNFVDLYQKQELSDNQYMVPFKYRNQRIKFTTNAFYFQEGKAKHFQQARFGQFRYRNGEMLLTNMVDKDFNVL